MAGGVCRIGERTGHQSRTMSHHFNPKEENKPAQTGHKKNHDRKLHKDWRLWLAVGLMLLAMLRYAL